MAVHLFGQFKIGYYLIFIPVSMRKIVNGLPLLVITPKVQGVHMKTVFSTWGYKNNYSQCRLCFAAIVNDNDQWLVLNKW